jgi:hypothetical protein
MDYKKLQPNLMMGVGFFGFQAIFNFTIFTSVMKLFQIQKIKCYFIVTIFQDIYQFYAHEEAALKRF